MRTAIKRVLMNGYCAGWVPAWFVTAGFKLFGLKSQWVLQRLSRRREKATHHRSADCF